MRAYDADKLLDILDVMIVGHKTASDVYDVVDSMPTVDAVPVVRCKDCKKYIPCQKLPIGTSKWCDMFDRATCEMNYCGWGERREDDSK